MASGGIEMGALARPASARPSAAALPLRRVLLVTPPYHCGMVESAGVWMPLGLAYLAGSLRVAGYSPEIYDAMSMGHGLAEVHSVLACSRPQVVAVTAYTATVQAAIAVLQAAKEEVPGCVTVMGGVHPTFMAEEVLRESAVDYVVRGEGEEALPDLLACLNGQAHPRDVPGISARMEDGSVLSAPDRPLVADLDRLPIAWDLLDWPRYHYRPKPGSRLAIASWARGCTQRCAFCSQHLLWHGTWRPRRIQAVVDELRMLRERFGVDTLEVADEWPTRDRQRWERLLDALIRADLGMELLIETRADDITRDEDLLERYRQAGILHVYVGAESASQERLDEMHKDLAVATSRRAIALLNRAGIITETSFLLGFPGDTPNTVQRALDMALECDPDLAFFLAVTPWPYTELYQQVRDRVEELDYSRYNLIHPIIRPEAMTTKELASLLSAAFMRFYSAKMRRLGRLPAHKREYLSRVARLLAEDSYLAEEARASLAAGELPVSTHVARGRA